MRLRLSSDHPFAEEQSQSAGAADREFLAALHSAFGGRPEEVNSVSIAVGYQGRDTVRSTTVERGGVIVAQSEPTAIRRS